MKVVVMVAGCLLAATAASAQVVRLSVATDGTQANGASAWPAVSATGRYVVFASSATNLVPADTDTISDLYLRDRDTDADGVFDEPGAVATTLLTVTTGGVKADGPSSRPAITPDGRYVAFESDAQNLVPGATGRTQIYRLDRVTGAIVRISVDAAGTAGDGYSTQAALSADGNVVAFRTTSANLAPATIWPDILIRDVALGTTTRVTRTPPAGVMLAPFTTGPSLSADGRRVAFIISGTNLNPRQIAEVVDRVTGVRTTFEESGPTDAFLDASGRYLITRRGHDVFRTVVDTGATVRLDGASAYPLPLSASSSGRYAVGVSGLLHDLDLGVSQALDFDQVGAAFSADDRWLVAGSRTEWLLPGNVDSNAVADVYAFDLPARRDLDGDSMNDRWERIFDLTDPHADPDGDGATNAEEEDAGTHPTGTVRQYLAEGATGAFFSTRLAVGNTNGGSGRAVAIVTLTNGRGGRTQRLVRLDWMEGSSVDLGGLRGFESGDVSITVESDRVLAVSRTMDWGRGSVEGARGHGSHAETATSAPSPSWFLAEGSTVLGFELFYLLQNPQPATTQATVRFLLPSGAVVTRAYNLPPHSRTTIHVNAVPGLDETDVSGDIAADAPIIVERAMYRSSATQAFALGTGAMGVRAPATRWFLAEGATGSFFDLYVLIANPSATAAQVTAEFARPDGTIVTQQYLVRSNSRYSVYVDAIPGLAATPVATTVTSTNGVPIVVERAMYWPGGFFDYHEGHSSAGATATAPHWAFMFDDHADDRYVLIANTENRGGSVEVVSFGEDVPASYRHVDLAANSRTTVPVPSVGRVTGVFVRGIGTSPLQLVVEGASYGTAGGVFWSSGSNALATPIP
jgi:Tol biopolymer transport system component